jgi:hypothetical protein
MVREMYHTQEARQERIKEPINCTKGNAWMGVAWYFWYTEDDAVFWGIASKRNTGYYDVYKANIDCENVLDTVFNEQHYLFWVKQIKKVEALFLKSGETLGLKQLNDYFIQKGIWSKFGGIMFQDISNNPNSWIIHGFQYRKRIQIAVYNKEIIDNFAHHFNGKCV